MYSDIYKKFVSCLELRCGIRKGSNDRIVAAVSGGADSVCLLLLLLEYFGKERVLCAHYNHMIRGKEAERDLCFTRDLAARFEIPFESACGNVPEYASQHGMGLEEAARTLRYRFLQELAVQKNAMIAVAHNQNDQVETVFHNIIRGTSIDGLKGISYRKERVIRPILNLSRDETEAVCAHYGITPVTDSTNHDTVYTRNKIRNEVLPYLKNVFGEALEEHFLRLSRTASLDSAYLQSVTASAFSDCCTVQDNGAILLNLPRYYSLHEAIQKRLIREICGKIKDSEQNLLFPEYTGIYSDMIERVHAAAIGGTPGKRIELSKGAVCVTTYDGVLFTNSAFPEQNRSFAPEQFCIRSEPCLPSEYESFLEKNGCLKEVFDREKLIAVFGEQFQIEFRTMREGDHFVPFGAQGGKSLRKYFIDCKINRFERSGMLLAAIGNEVLWIPGMRRSTHAPIDKNTSRVIILEYNAKAEVIHESNR